MTTEQIIILSLLVAVFIELIGSISIITKLSNDKFKLLAEKQSLDKKIERSRIMKLTAFEFDDYLMRELANVVYTESRTHVNMVDPNRQQELTARCLTAFNLRFIDNKDVIDSCYGEDYISKWFKNHYQLLEHMGILNRTMDQTTSVQDIYTALVNCTKTK